MLLLVACEDEDSSPVVILVSPDKDIMNAKTGDKLLYTVEAFSGSGVVERLKFISKDARQGVVNLLDTVVSSSRVKIDFEYVVPSLDRDSVRIALKFGAGTADDYTSVMRSVRVLNSEVLLEEESGYTMYSASSSKPDAFLWFGSQSVYSELEADSLIDIYDYHNPLIQADSLTREWRSGSGIKFVRYNDFNYPRATAGSIRQAYEAGIKYSALKMIHADDIILLGNERGVLGVIRIVNVIDESGPEHDRYVFNLKKAMK